MLVMVLGGFVLVGVAAWVAQANDVLHRLTLEVNGTRGMATAEPLAAGEYRLRMALDSSIYARSYSGRLRSAESENNAELSVPVVYDPADPIRFLPSGQAYVSAVISGLLFLLGMTWVLMARRTAFAAARIQRLSRLKAEEERKRKEHRARQKRRHHQEHQHGA